MTLSTPIFHPSNELLLLFRSRLLHSMMSMLRRSCMSGERQDLDPRDEARNSELRPWPND